ncbi:hypothetical protein SUDANB19_05128 [Streptomyces sp. enrichment culture]
MPRSIVRPGGAGRRARGRGGTAGRTALEGGAPARGGRRSRGRRRPERTGAPYGRPQARTRTETAVGTWADTAAGTRTAEPRTATRTDTRVRQHRRTVAHLGRWASRGPSDEDRPLAPVRPERHPVPPLMADRTVTQTVSALAPVVAGDRGRRRTHRPTTITVGDRGYLLSDARVNDQPHRGRWQGTFPDPPPETATTSHNSPRSRPARRQTANAGDISHRNLPHPRTAPPRRCRPAGAAAGRRRAPLGERPAAREGPRRGGRGPSGGADAAGGVRMPRVVRVPRVLGAGCQSEQVEQEQQPLLTRTSSMTGP